MSVLSFAYPRYLWSKPRRSELRLLTLSAAFDV